MVILVEIIITAMPSVNKTLRKSRKKKINKKVVKAVIDRRIEKLFNGKQCIESENKTIEQYFTPKQEVLDLQDRQIDTEKEQYSIHPSVGFLKISPFRSSKINNPVNGYSGSLLSSKEKCHSKIKPSKLWNQHVSSCTKISRQ